MRLALGIVWRRAIHLVPVALLATFVSFLLVNLQKGNVALAILGTSATPTSIREFDLKYGLNHPLLYRYFDWLWQALHGHLGYSYETGQTVASEIAERYPITLELVLLGLGIAIPIAIFASLLAARRPMGVADWTSRGISMFGFSVPGFVVGPLLLLVFTVKFHLFPSVGFVPITQSLTQNLRVMILPAVSLAFAFFAVYTRILRGDMIDQLVREEYVNTAKSKGLSEWRILLHHVFRNSLFSFITVVGTNFGVLLGGAVVTEFVFSLAGMGQLLQAAASQKDSPVVQGVVCVICLSVVAANLLADIAYQLLDPRVRYGSSR